MIIRLRVLSTSSYIPFQAFRFLRAHISCLAVRLDLGSPSTIILSDACRIVALG
jgi:hypothetical protein